jgi:hypothetical protein
VDGDGVFGSCDALDGDGVKKVFYLNFYPVHSMHDVIVDGDTLGPGEYCYDLASGWISLQNAPPAGMANVIVCYDYSRDLDLAVTNWDPPTGNFLFDNTTTGIQEYVSDRGRTDARHLAVRASPNPWVAQGGMGLEVSVRVGSSFTDDLNLRVYDASGRQVKRLAHSSDSRTGGAPGRSLTIKWDGRDSVGRDVPSGTYFIRAEFGSVAASRKVVLLR